MATVTDIRVGSLIKTPDGVFGVVSNYDKKDKKYIINWVNGMRSSVAYDKQAILNCININKWLYLSPDQKVC
tara:strand:- start:750 stop:965 length:216 start_codon:yes stop_codon:yes gene_type:complete